MASTLLAGLVAVEVAFDAGSVVVAAVLVGMALWLAAFDDWRRPLRRGGQGQYAALAMLLGALWLGAGGAIWLWVAPVRFGSHYDAVVHTFFLGFVISAILAHGPIILPSVSGRSVRFGWRLLAPLLLLHGSLAVRVAADLEGWRDGREWGGLFNAVALVVFLVCMASLSLPAGRRGAAWLRVRAAEQVTAPNPGSRTR